jgi:hypothetical protein
MRAEIHGGEHDGATLEIPEVYKAVRMPKRAYHDYTKPPSEDDLKQLLQPGVTYCEFRLRSICNGVAHYYLVT